MKCRLLPHGAYCLLPIVFSSMAFWSLLIQDGCDYAKLQGGESVELITGSTVLPFLEIGRTGYRAPLYHANVQQWKIVYTRECTIYSNQSTKIMDGWWRASQWLSFLSFCLGGAVSFFLWLMVAMSLSIRTWRFCGIWIMLALFCRAGSFLFFQTHLCHTTTFNNTSSCRLFFGSQMDIGGVVAWSIAAIAILAYYPAPLHYFYGSSSKSQQLQYQQQQSATKMGNSRDGLMRDAMQPRGGRYEYDQQHEEMRPMAASVSKGTTAKAFIGSGGGFNQHNNINTNSSGRQQETPEKNWNNKKSTMDNDERTSMTIGTRSSMGDTYDV